MALLFALHHVMDRHICLSAYRELLVHLGAGTLTHLPFIVITTVMALLFILHHIIGHHILYILAYQELTCLGVETLIHLLLTVITTKMALLILHHIVCHHLSLPGTSNVGTPWFWNTDTSPLHCHHVDDTVHKSGPYDCLSHIPFLLSLPLIN